MVGRPSEPAALKLLKGTGDGKDSGGRTVPVPPKFKRQAPEKPDSLTGVAAEVWDEIVEALEDVDVLKVVDGPALLIACETFARWDEARQMRASRGITVTTSQGVGVAPWVRVEEAAAKDFRAWCSEFGLTPSAEMKLAKDVTDGGSEDNPFA